ncbi:MAG: hypothetical protein JSS43_13580 [Proteobacteria bacterium]|nr:hypothetical protein [Pseudomonadota bacterium]
MSALEPTDADRRLVRAMSGFGIPQGDIAAHLGIDPKSLRKHFRQDLDRGMTEANVKVAQSLFQMATEGKNVAAAIFWMKSRAGWREKPLPDEGKGPNITTIERIVIAAMQPAPTIDVDGEIEPDG